MAAGKATLVAARRREGLPPGLVPLFPDESAPGIPLKREELYALSPLYSRLFRELVGTAAPALSRRLSLAPPASEALARQALVPLTHTFLDRLLRLDRFFRAVPPSNVAFALPPSLQFPARAERFRHMAGWSFALNQTLVARLAVLWGVQASDVILPDAEPPATTVSGFVNNNFSASSIPQKARRVLKLALHKVSGPKRPIPVLSMGYSLDAFKNAGFYGAYFKDVRGRAGLSDGKPDPALRAELKTLASGFDQPLRAFLSAAGFSGPGLAPSGPTEAFARFVADAYPSAMLEAAKANVEACEAVLRPFLPAPLIIGEFGDLEAMCMAAAAKSLGQTFVDFQHGGHIGYIQDQTIPRETELYTADRFVTWGWTRLPDYPEHPSPPRTALPNPWLSERAKRWRPLVKSLLKRDEREFDFLLLSNRMYPFTPSPNGAYQTVSDHIAPISASFQELAREAKRRDIKILHKPYNHTTTSLLKDTYAAMEREGVSVQGKLDKGMTPELLRRCRFVLWDQPGTGFLECMAAGIPAMAYWPPICCVPDGSAAVELAHLEAAGIIHRKLGTLFDQALAARAGLKRWMEAPDRLNAIGRFSRTYGWADDAWETAWKTYLTQL